MDKRNRLYIIIMAVVVFFTAILMITFAYINKPTVSGNVNTNATVLDNSDALSLTYSGATSLGLSIDVDKLNADEASDSYTSFISNSADIGLTLTSDANMFPNGATCTYDIMYTPTVAYYSSSGAMSNSLMELTISGTNGSISFPDENLYGISGVGVPWTLKTASISTTSSNASVNQTWTFTMKFYNLDVDQSSALGQSPSGTITFKPVDCEAN